MPYKKLSNIPWQIVNENAVIIDPAQNKIHELDEVGTAIWEKLDGQSTPQQIALDIADVYSVEESMALNDIEDFCETLLQEGLISSTEYE